MKYMRFLISAVILMASATEVTAQSFELPMPEIPAEMPREQRPAYVVGHFWDALDASDTTLTHSREFMEPNAANFFYLLPYASPEARGEALGGFVRRLETDSLALDLFLNLAEEYVAEPESPMHNDAVAYEVMDAYHRLPSLRGMMRERVEYQREMLAKNLPGVRAADFEFITPSGEKKTLHASLSTPTVLLFYDPECSSCLQTIESLRSAGETAVIAICVEGSRESWLSIVATLPEGWLSGYDLTDVVGNDLYYIRSLPALYRLAPDATILE